MLECERARAAVLVLPDAVAERVVGQVQCSQTLVGSQACAQHRGTLITDACTHVCARVCVVFFWVPVYAHMCVSESINLIEFQLNPRASRVLFSSRSDAIAKTPECSIWLSFKLSH